MEGTNQKGILMILEVCFVRKTLRVEDIYPYEGYICVIQQVRRDV